MAETVPVSSNEILHCPICLEKYKTPRALPCLHTFCEDCLDTFIQSQKQEGSAFPCPVCRSSTTLPDTKPKVEKWASSFPLNHMVVSLMDTEVRQVSDKTLCESCKNINEEVPAVFWCQECSDGLCDVCHGFHKRLRITSGHNTIPIEEAASQELKQKTQVDLVDEGCPRHRGKSLEVFCEDHRELCCLVCFVRGHRDCKTIRDIDEIAEEQQSKRSIDDITQGLMEIKATMEDVIKMKNDQKEKLDHEKSHLIKEMETMVKTSKQMLDKLLSVYQNEVSTVHSQGSRTLVNSKARAQEFVTNIENSIKLVQFLHRGVSPRQTFVMYEKIRSQISSHYTQLKKDFEEDSEYILRAKINSTFNDLGTLTSIGAVDTTSTQSTPARDIIAAVGDVIQKKLGADVGVKDLMTASVSLIKTIERTEIGAKWLTGGTFLNSGHLLLADHHGKKFIELNEQWTVIGTSQLGSYPRTVSFSEENEIVFCSFFDGKVKQYQAKSGFQLIKEIPTKGNIYGVAVSGDTLISCKSETLDFTSLDGSLKKSVPKTGDYKYVTVSHRTKNVYHGDGNMIVCRKQNGDKCFSYSDGSLQDPRGIGLDADDNVYVCGKESGNVHQISADGQRSRVLLDKLQKIRKPQWIVINSKKNFFLVTSDQSEATAMEVYSFSV